MYTKAKMKTLTPDLELSKPFTMDELNSALQNTKSGKSAGFDSIFPEFLKYLGLVAKKCFLIFTTRCWLQVMYQLLSNDLR